MEVHSGDGDGEIDADGEGSHPGKQTQEHEQTAEKFGEGGEVGTPCGKSQAGDELNVMMQAAENFMVSVVDDDGTEHETHNEERQGLQAIEVAQVVPPAEKKG